MNVSGFLLDYITHGSVLILLCLGAKVRNGATAKQHLIVRKDQFCKRILSLQLGDLIKHLPGSFHTLLHTFCFLNIAVQTGSSAYGDISRYNPLLHSQLGRTDETILGAQLSCRIATHTLAGIQQSCIGKAIEKISDMQLQSA